MINVAERYDLDMGGQRDNTVKLAQLGNDIAAIFAAKKPMPRLVFPEGVVLFDSWPNLAYGGLKICADGECVLQHTGKGDAVVFDGPAIYPEQKQGGPDGLVFEGFTLQPSMAGGDGLIINSCHRSRFDVFVNQRVKPSEGYSAIHVIFSILTEIRPRVSGYNQECIGLRLDALPNLPPTANRISLPILEGCSHGVFIAAGGYNNFYDGTIESCDIGIEIDDGGNNHFMMVEMEGNKTWDVVTTSEAHDNFFWFCGEGHPSKFKTDLLGWNNRTIHGKFDGLFGL